MWIKCWTSTLWSRHLRHLVHRCQFLFVGTTIIQHFNKMKLYGNQERVHAHWNWTYMWTSYLRRLLNLNRGPGVWFRAIFQYNSVPICGILPRPREAESYGLKTRVLDARRIPVQNPHAKITLSRFFAVRQEKTVFGAARRVDALPSDIVLQRNFAPMSLSHKVHAKRTSNEVDYPQVIGRLGRSTSDREI